MSKLILKDKTEIMLQSHYGETYVTEIENFAQLDSLKDKLTATNTSIMTLQEEGKDEQVITGLKLQGINTHFVKDNAGAIIQIYALLMFKALSEMEQFKVELINRVDILSDTVAEFLILRAEE